MSPSGETRCRARSSRMQTVGPRTAEQWTALYQQHVQATDLGSATEDLFLAWCQCTADLVEGG
eukprot:6455231-Amphidinium_carterae.1